MLSLVMNIVQVALLIFRWIEHRGKINDARRAVEADLLRLAELFKRRSTDARDAVVHTPDSVLNDPDNRDT